MQSIQDLIRDARNATPQDFIDSALETVRRHLGMEIAYLSELVDGQLVFRAVSAPGLEQMIKPGDSRSLDEVYCRHIIAGRLPRLIRDTADEALAMAMPITSQVPIGSHVSVPVRREDGSIYGMFCCLSPTPSPSLNDRDLAVMELFAGLSGEQINKSLALRGRREGIEAWVSQTISFSEFKLLYQPIHDLERGEPVGFEALCRFFAQPYRSPDQWFAEAAEVGQGAALEFAVAAQALIALDLLPQAVYVSINASPDTVAGGGISELLAGYDISRVVLEVTEHASVTDYGVIERELAPLRGAGMRLAIDDAGAGYAGLQHILRLRPDIIKLDMSLTARIDIDHARRSLAGALVGFAAQTGAMIVAEGIETVAELAALRALGITCGQGYLLGRPESLGAAVVRVTAPHDVALRA